MLPLALSVQGRCAAMMVGWLLSFFSMGAGGLILLHYCTKVLFKASVVEFEGSVEQKSKAPKSPTAAFGCLVVGMKA